MIEYKVESLHDIGEEIREIGRENWEDVKYSPLDEFEFAQNDDTYYFLEDANMLRVITARDVDELVGYVIILVQPLTHHANNLCGSELGFYVKPGKRGAAIGTALIKEAENLCRSVGVDVLEFHVPPTFDYSALLRRQKFEDGEKIYMKRLI